MVSIGVVWSILGFLAVNRMTERFDEIDEVLSRMNAKRKR